MSGQSYTVEIGHDGRAEYLRIIDQTDGADGVAMSLDGHDDPVIMIKPWMELNPLHMRAMASILNAWALRAELAEIREAREAANS